MEPKEFMFDNIEVIKDIIYDGELWLVREILDTIFYYLEDPEPTPDKFEAVILISEECDGKVIITVEYDDIPEVLGNYYEELCDNYNDPIEHINLADDLERMHKIHSYYVDEYMETIL